MTKFIKKSSALLLIISLLLSILCGCGPVISLNDIPEYTYSAYVEINGNVPFFEDSEITDRSFESYSELDALGRCGVAFACIGIDIMPTEERGEIASITPTGWEYAGVSNNNSYDFIKNGYVYNRCHLIGHQLAGENDNEKNLITGTRYMNLEGMLPFEDMVAEYVKSTKNHVMYRVTPIFHGLDYMAKGVLMEAYSVEDNGRGISFCIYAYNVQPGVTIDYFTGVNVANGQKLPDINTDEDDRNNVTEDTNGNNGDSSENNGGSSGGEVCDYVLNTGTKKIHKPDCSSAPKPDSKNYKEFNGTKEELLADNYVPCKICNP
jgi:DNA-entry nuclease